MIFLNRYFDKNRLKALVLWSLTKSGEKTTIDLVENLKDMGFHYATKAGLSLSIDDLKIPPTKAELILETELILHSAQKEYENGNITGIERFQQLIDVWHRTSEVLKQNVIQHFRATDILNPVYMMAFSGARGNISQVRQLVGMRGLMADPQGQILDFPIRSNFREGLTLTEYVISCYGARKGLVDTALRTANSGYLTRRLVDVAQHVVVTTEDCRTTSGIYITDMQDGRKVILSLQKRLIGRVLAEDIKTVSVLIKKNQDISPTFASIISKNRKQVLVRSPLTCKETKTVCQLCYGWSLAHGTVVSLGEAVGILAAQSIGEPGTQLTMRTFHTGGVFSGDVMQEIRSPIDGTIHFSCPLQGKLIRTLHGKIAFLTKVEGEFSISENLDKKKSNSFYKIPGSTVLFVRHKQQVKKGELISEFAAFVTKSNQGIQAKFNLNAEKEGEIFFENVVFAYKETDDEDPIRIAVQVGSICILEGKVYESPIRSPFFPEIGDLVDTKTIINQSLLTTPYTGLLESSVEHKQKKNFFPIWINKNKEEIKSETLQDPFQTRNYVFPNFTKKIADKQSRNIDVKNSFATFSLHKIQFKKFGYFFSLKNIPGVTFFFPNVLETSKNKSSLISFQIIDTLFESRNFIQSSLNLKEYEDQIFFIPHRFYKLPQKKDIPVSKKIYRNFLYKKNNLLLSTTNSKGCEKTIQTNKNQLIFIEATQNKEISCIKIKNKKTKFFYRENPYKNFNKKFYDKNQSSKIGSFPVFWNSEIKEDKHYSVHSKTNFFPKKNKGSFFTISKLQLESGWVMFLKGQKNPILISSRITRPGNSFNQLQFDQSFTVQKLITINEVFSFFEKSTDVRNFRYINNKFCRINKINGENKLFFEKRKKVSRYPLYTQNFYINSKAVLLTKKLNETNFPSRVKKQKLLQTFSNQKANLEKYSISAFLNNKQQKTILASLSTNIKIEINLLEKQHKSILNTPTLCINYFLPKQESGNGYKIELQLPEQLVLSSIRKLTTLNYLTLTQENTEKIFITKQNNIFEQQNFSFSSFCSPYVGEITSKTLDTSGKEKSLLVTVKEQHSFQHDNTTSEVKLGQLIRYGDKVFKGVGIEEAGQIIETSKNTITVRKAQPILFSSKGIFHIDQGDLVKKNTPLMTLFYQKLKTEDIVQGIPKIEELFEARQTKEGEALQGTVHNKLHFFFKFYRKKYNFEEATRKSFKQLQQILVQEVQKVYQSQGVTIADKHIEIIVREMTSKVKITESGKTGFFRGELTALRWVELVNLGRQAISYSGIKSGTILDSEIVGKAEYEPVVLGITKAALETESFISAASFQETTRILSRAAIERKTDFLRGLKENVILGHIIPAGTGYKRLRDPDFVGIIGKKLSVLNYSEIVKIMTQIRTGKVKKLFNSTKEIKKNHKKNHQDYLLKQELREKLWSLKK